MRRRSFLPFIAVAQVILFLAHFLLYQTWTFSSVSGRTPGLLWLKLVLGVLCFTFLPASILAFRYTSAPVRVFYRIAAVWMGLLSFLFIATAFSWILYAVAVFIGLPTHFHRLVELLFGVAMLATTNQP